jgi:hypothetical protein
MSWIDNLSKNLISNADLYIGDDKVDTVLNQPITQPTIQIKKQKIVKNYNISWNLIANIDDIDFTQNYSCYDDKCLDSTFFIDEMLDFANDQGFTKIGYKHPKINEFNILIECDINEFTKKIKNFIEFKTGKFITHSITRLDNNDDIYNLL